MEAWPGVNTVQGDTAEAQNRGLNAGDLRKARQIVEENRELFLEMWNEYCHD